MRLAHFGTFDVENFGDLLFPLVLKRRLAALEPEVVVFVSPVGGPPVWGDCVTTVATGEAPADVDGVVLGGGNIVHGGIAGAAPYDRDGRLAISAYADLWTTASRIAYEAGVPLCWNAPGVPQELPGRVAEVLREALAGASHVSVRDHPSARRLRNGGVDQPVHVVCDTALDVTRLWSPEELDVAHAALFADRGTDVPERTLAVHANRRYLDGTLDDAAQKLDGVALALDARIVLLALGPCHGDGRLATDLADRMQSDPVLVERPRSLREVVAAISRADAYAGSSLHGMVTACAFDVPGVLVAREPVPGKFAGFLELLGIERLLFESWEAAAARLPDVCSADRRPFETGVASARRALDDHWDKLVAALRAPAGSRRGLVRSRDAVAATVLPTALDELVFARQQARTRAAALHGSIAELEAARAALGERLETALGAHDAERQVSESARAELRTRSQELDVARATIAELRAEAERQLSELARLREEVARSRSAQEHSQLRIVDLSRRLQRTEAEVEGLSSQLAQAEAEKARLKQDLETAEVVAATRDRESERHAAHAAELSREAEQARAETTRLSQQLEEITRDLHDREQAVVSVRSELAASDGALAEARLEVRDHADAVERARADARTQRAALDAARNELAELHRTAVSARQLAHALERARADSAARDVALERVQGELRIIEDLVARIEASRSWRTGHALMVIGRRLTFRAPKGGGALPLMQRHARRASEAAVPLRSSPPALASREHAAAAATSAPPTPKPTDAEPPAARVLDERRDARMFLTRWDEAAAEEAASDVPLDRLRLLRHVGAATDGPSVDVVVCVHDALADVRRCLASLLERSTTSFSLIIVDDGSAPDTADFLNRFARVNTAVKLIRNSEGRHGYTIAANLGLRESAGEYVVLLNSDTIVTPHWLEHIVECGEQDPSVGIIGPLSNAATHQSVPEAKGRDGWMVNSVPEWLTPDGIAAIVEEVGGAPITVPFLNGFCYAIRRRTIQAVGAFDEEHFAEGYSEENDYSRRAAGAGISLAIATRAYVFHAKSRSYGHEARKELAKRQYRKFLDRYGEAHVRQLVEDLEGDPGLALTRARVAAAVGSPRDTVERFPRLAISFVLPGMSAGGSGGSHSIYQEVTAMRDLGIDATVAISRNAIEHARWAYSDAEDVFAPFGDVAELARVTRSSDVIVATHHASVELVSDLRRTRDDFLPAYYVQDYEPLFAAPGSPAEGMAMSSYTAVPGQVLFAKTDWLCRFLAATQGVRVARVEPSIDHAIFHADGRRDRGDGRVRVTAMVRPRTVRRAPAMTLAVLDRLIERCGDRIEIVTFGCRREELDTFGRVSSGVRHQGVLNRSQVARLLRETDVFLDCSWYQAFGRTALEAMACGAAAVVPERGGAVEFADQGRNAVIVDTLDEEAVVRAIAALLDDPNTLVAMSAAAIGTASTYSAVRAALSEYLLFQREFRLRTGARRVSSKSARSR